MKKSFLNEQQAVKLLEINKMLTKSLKLEEVLHNVIKAAKELITVSDTLILYLYDEKTEKLHLAEGEGIDKQYLHKIAFSPGESITGKVFADRQSKLFASEKEIDSYMQNMTPENYAHYYKGVFNRKIKSAFCVPILHKERCLGALVVDNFEQDNVFTETDMNVIKIVADQSAIAIDNSNMYESLKEKNELLTQSTSIHNQFYRLIIQGGGIDKVLRLLESIIGSAVTHKATAFYAPSETIYPIVRGNDVLGILQLEKPFKAFGRMDQIAIEHASSTIALELVKDNALFEKELHFREEVFNQLLEGVAFSDLQRIRHYMKWEDKWPVQCIIIEGAQEPLWNKDKLTDKEWFVRTVEQIVNAICGNGFVFTKAYQLILIIPVTKEHAIDSIVNRIEKQWGNKKQFLYGIGRETSIQELTVSYQEAIRSIKYAKTTAKANMVKYAELGMERLLYEVDPSILETYMHDKLDKLLNTDRSFLETLQSFIQYNKNHKQVAEVLNIHPNTLYYRLKKIEEMLHIDLTNQQDWIDVVIAIRLFVAGDKN